MPFGRVRHIDLISMLEDLLIDGKNLRDVKSTYWKQHTWYMVTHNAVMPVLLLNYIFYFKVYYVVFDAMRGSVKHCAYNFSFQVTGPLCSL